MKTLFKRFALRIQKAFLEFPADLSVPEQDLGPEEDLSPIFIIGPPRTGSTLLFQLMVQRFQIAYLSNLMALIPRHMSKIAKRTRPWMRSDREVRESRYGYVSGWLAPNEGGAIFRYWFEDQSVNPKLIRNTVGEITRIFEAPFVSKNLHNSLRIPAIRAIFPQARFIYIRRDPLYTAQSLWIARKRELKDESAWFGTRPPGFELVLKNPPAYQVLWQVLRIEQLIREQLQGFGASALELSYEELCSQTEPSLSRIERQFGLKRKQTGTIPNLLIRKEQQLSPAEWDGLRDAHEQLSKLGLLP